VSGSLTAGRFFQLGYVVRDLDAGLEGMRGRTGAADWQVKRLAPGSVIEGTALAYANGIMLELIAVDGGNVPAVYASHVPAAADEARLHHLGFMMATKEEFDAVIERSQVAGVAEAASFEHDGVFSYYADSRAQVGCYTEYVYLSPPIRDYFASVPYN
jgi:hypothetical protein